MRSVSFFPKPGLRRSHWASAPGIPLPTTSAQWPLEIKRLFRADRFPWSPVMLGHLVLRPLLPMGGIQCQVPAQRPSLRPASPALMSYPPVAMQTVTFLLKSMKWLCFSLTLLNLATLCPLVLRTTGRTPEHREDRIRLKGEGLHFTWVSANSANGTSGGGCEDLSMTSHQDS